jgi:release factor glutamine methyltransferase
VAPDDPKHEGAGPIPTVRSALIAAHHAVGDQTTRDYARDVRALLANALACTQLDLLTDPSRPIGHDQYQGFLAAIERRRGGEPVARIMGFRDFFGRPFRLSPATLEPRLDSECLIDATLSLLRTDGREGERLRILDIGTGSGCLLLTLLAELPMAIGIGTDISAAALATATDNAHRLGVERRASFVCGSSAAGVGGFFDLVISNPPYVRSGDLADLDADVRLWDPVLALDGGADGLDVYRVILNDIPDRISDGYIVFETGYDQAQAVAHLLEAAFSANGAARAMITHDMAGRPRCVTFSTSNRTDREKYLGLPVE